MFIQGHFSPCQSLGAYRDRFLWKQEYEGRNFVTDWAKDKRSTHFQFNVFHLVGRWWMPAVGHGEIT